MYVREREDLNATNRRSVSSQHVALPACLHAGFSNLALSTYLHLETSLTCVHLAGRPRVVHCSATWQYHNCQNWLASCRLPTPYAYHRLTYDLLITSTTFMGTVIVSTTAVLALTLPSHLRNADTCIRTQVFLNFFLSCIFTTVRCPMSSTIRSGDPDQGFPFIPQSGVL